MYISLHSNRMLYTVSYFATHLTWQALQDKPLRLWIIYCTIWFCVFEAGSNVSAQTVPWASSCSLCYGVGRRAPCAGVISPGMNISSGAIWIPFAQGHIIRYWMSSCSIIQTCLSNAWSRRPMVTFFVMPNSWVTIFYFSPPFFSGFPIVSSLHWNNGIYLV